MLKVGDKVKVRGDLKAEWYGNLRCDPEMLLYAEKEAIITDRFSHRKAGLYKIDLDDGVWMWNENMFEPVEIVDKDKFEEFMRS